MPWVVPFFFFWCSWTWKMQVLISLTRFIIFLNIHGHKTITAWSTHSQKVNTELWFVKQKENSDFVANSQLGVNFINWSLLKGVFLVVFGVVFGVFFVVCLSYFYLSTIRFKGNVLAHSVFHGSGFNYLENPTASSMLWSQCKNAPSECFHSEALSHFVSLWFTQ